VHVLEQHHRRLSRRNLAYDVYQQAALGNDFGIDLESVKRIEVIRGPGAALYGGSAFFAVVNVVTEEAPEAPGVHVLAETGSFVRKRGRGRIGHVFGNGLEVYAAGSVLDVDGPENLFYPEYASPKTHYGIAHDVDGEQAIACS
jgi:outer membrane receptor protein involved in Fe transport